VHLKPRRVARKGSDLTAEIWFAPSLAYLPVRIRIQQDANTFIVSVPGTGHCSGGGLCARRADANSP
jgi:hypothetical protein